MADLKKIIQCPKCRFTNRLGDERCLICKSELPKTIPPAAEAPRSPEGPNPASNAAAAARASSAKPIPGVMRKIVDPFARPPQATAQAKRPEPVTTIRHAEDEGLLATNVADERPPKPLTNRIAKLPKAVEAVAWLWCDPLPAIPLVSGKQVIVGRQDTCDLVLPHKQVSRAHAVFKVSGKQITLEDQGSSNGCFVNTKRCTNQIVKVGDKVEIGPYEIEIRDSGEELSPKDGSDTKSFDLTSVNATGPGASMAGNLSDVPLSEILQGIEFHAKTCTLSISDGKLKGKVIFAAGKPVTASWGGERDLDAVRCMLRLKDGRFFLSNDVEPTDATMKHTVTALLLDDARDLDEATAPPDEEEDALPKPSATVIIEEPLEGDGLSTEPPPVEAYGLVDENPVTEPPAAAAVGESPPEEPREDPPS